MYLPITVHDLFGMLSLICGNYLPCRSRLLSWDPKFPTESSIGFSLIWPKWCSQIISLAQKYHDLISCRFIEHQTIIVRYCQIHFQTTINGWYVVWEDWSCNVIGCSSETVAWTPSPITRSPRSFCSADIWAGVKRKHRLVRSRKREEPRYLRFYLI